MTLETPAPNSTYQVAVLTAWISGVFVALVCAVMIFQRFTASSIDPWKSPELVALKDELRAAPKDVQVKERIRQLDLEFRLRQSRRLALDRTGRWLLLAGSIVLAVALKTAAHTRRTRYRPCREPEAAERVLRQTVVSRRAVAIAGGVVLAGMLAAVFLVPSYLPTGGKETQTPAGSTADATAALPPAAEFARNWPRFRGPDGSGAALGEEAPLRWDAKTGAGVAWKTVVPAPGYNSPIVWGDRVFVSGATREKREIFCFDAANGRLLWQCAVEPPQGPVADSPEIQEETGYAASTMATDGRRVYAIFGHGHLAAVTFDGKVAWAKHLGVPKNPYGYATSLAVWQGRVIVQFDQGDSEPVNSKLLAFDGATGRQVWEKARPVSSSWATPIIVEAAGKTQIITLGPPFVIAYGFADGAELWRLEGLEGEVVPSPIFAGGLVMVVSPSHALMAIRPDGTGNVKATHLAWQSEESMPDITSPVSDGTRVFTVTSGGQLVCLDTKDGRKAWEKDLETEVHASPSIFGRRLYVVCTNGTTVVAELGPEFRELARNELGERILASPAFAAGRLYLRGVQHLFCLTSGDKPTAAAR